MATARQGERTSARRGSSESDFHVLLEHGRWRHFSWIVIGAVAGTILIWKLGAVGKGVGLVLIGIGAFHAYQFGRTLLHDAGRIELRADSVLLPDALCRKDTHAVPYAQVRHAFFLRRAVPWSLTGPVLVVETSERVFLYPRDWFASDSDQRRVALSLNRRLGRL